MASSLVIKVKHGETLRRFSARVDVSGKLDLDIDRLRKKILGLFNFVPDANFSLTYTDEDGDVITLVDEEDLHDIMKQCLNPLRITVKLSGSIHQKMSLGTPQHLSQNLNADASIKDILKSIPESFFEALSKVPLDSASKAMFSAIAELADCFTKTKGLYMNPLLKLQASAAPTAQKDTSELEASRNSRNTWKEMHRCTLKDLIDPSGNVPSAPMIKESGVLKNGQAASEVVLKSCALDRNSSAQNSMEGVRKHRESDFTDMYPRVGPLRLNSQFIWSSSSDLQNTVLAPSTQFTKIWRILNNGLDPWPRGTQLVWTAGENFSNELGIKLEIPITGLPVGNELQVSASFVAPQLPGNHLSYWCLASPSGQCFGEHVGVCIQVRPSHKDSSNKNSGGFDLNLLPESKDSGDELSGLAPMDMEEQIVSANPNVKPSTPTAATIGALRSRMKTQKYNRTMVETALRTDSAYPSTKKENGNSDVEQTLLNELDNMGFKQVDLKREILRLNKYDLEQSVVDLCCGFELDPKLKELQNLGFNDVEKNKKLLLKYFGSIDDVIWDLI